MKNYKICVVGLGTVGLDIAQCFAKKYYTTGYDIDNELIQKLKLSQKKNRKIIYTSNISELVSSNVYIVTVPTPVLKNNSPNLKFVIDATKVIAKNLKEDNIIIYESTVYPGATEEIFIPLIEKISKKKINKDFFVGYSPERLNTGESPKYANDVIKVTSGSNIKSSVIIDDLYNSVIEEGTHRAENIKIAESCKLLENCQRDINIAFMNEFSIIMKKLNIDISKVIEASKTKWNFNEYEPGLVGGDCIATDPYYLIFKAKQINQAIPLISKGREINSKMLNYCYKSISELIFKHDIRYLKILFLGVAYKANSKQLNNSMYLALANKLAKNYEIDICDDNIDNDEERLLYQIKKYDNIEFEKYNLIIIGTPHLEFKHLDIHERLKKEAIVVDINGINGSKNIRII